MAPRVVRGDQGPFYPSHGALVIDGVKKREVEMMSGVCQGMPGAGARHDSMSHTSGRELRRLAPVI